MKSNQIKRKNRFFLSMVWALCICSMFLPWFGGARGEQEIPGTLVLYNPITLIVLIIIILSIWININKGLLIGSSLLLILIEVFYYFTWYYYNITSDISLINSISLSFPEFYLGISLSIILLVSSIKFTKN